MPAFINCLLNRLELHYHHYIFLLNLDYTSESLRQKKGGRIELLYRYLSQSLRSSLTCDLLLNKLPDNHILQCNCF